VASSIRARPLLRSWQSRVRPGDESHSRSPCRARTCRGRALPVAPFFALVEDVSPEGIELRTTQLVIAHQHFFNLFAVRGGLREPGCDSLFLDAFDAMERGQRIAFGEQRQAFEDRLLVVLLAVEDRPASFSKDSCAGCALPSLTPLACESELAQIASVGTTIIGAFLVPADRTRRD